MRRITKEADVNKKRDKMLNKSRKISKEKIVKEKRVVELLMKKIRDSLIML